jgi:hypothetical protein
MTKVVYFLIREDEMGRACSTHGDMINAYTILVIMPKGKRPLGRPRRRWKYNIKWISGK